MADKVKLSKDGSSIDFVQSDNVPTSLKKFRQSPEIEGFYRFVFENDLQKEAFDILDKIVAGRKLKKALDRKVAKQANSKDENLAVLQVKKGSASAQQNKVEKIPIEKSQAEKTHHEKARADKLKLSKRESHQSAFKEAKTQHADKNQKGSAPLQKGKQAAPNKKSQKPKSKK